MICLTFDTERNFYGSVVKKGSAYREKSYSMLEDAIPKLLEIADEYDIHYTFFLCGEVAENCPRLFTGLKKHCIGVHTHPFTHRNIFKGTSPNDRERDRLERYTFGEQYEMVSEDLELITDVGVQPKVFRAGKYSANRDTFKILDKLGFKIDCSMYFGFQLIGWQPFRIPNTSMWEIPAYCDLAPELIPQIKKLFRISNMIKSFYSSGGIYVGTIHPMIFGNPEIDSSNLFKHYREMIEMMLEWEFRFLTIEEAFKQVNKDKNQHNIIGKIFRMPMIFPHYLFRKGVFK